MPLELFQYVTNHPKVIRPERPCRRTLGERRDGQTGSHTSSASQWIQKNTNQGFELGLWS